MTPVARGGATKIVHDSRILGISRERTCGRGSFRHSIVRLMLFDVKKNNTP